MARSKGLIQLEGPLGNLSFYNSVFGPIVRQKGGPSKEKIRKSPKMVRVRDQNKEFGEAVRAAKLLRTSLNLKVKVAKEHSITWRVNQLMNWVKDKDTNSLKGKRTVENGLASTAGKNLLNGFDITQKASLKKILTKAISVNVTVQSISINQIVPSKDIKFPKGATHVRFRGGYSRIDFGKEKYDKQEGTDVVLNLKSKTSTNILLQMAPASLNTGYDVYFVCLEFLQEVNSSFYDLDNKRYNCLSLVKVS
jgi:hypothetical protein